MTDTENDLRKMLADFASDLHTHFLDDVDFYDIEYRCDGGKNYKSALVKITHGAPNIYIDTEKECLIGYWGQIKVNKALPSTLSRRINNYFADKFYNC